MARLSIQGIVSYLHCKRQQSRRCARSIVWARRDRRHLAWHFTYRESGLTVRGRLS